MRLSQSEETSSGKVISFVWLPPGSHLTPALFGASNAELVFPYLYLYFGDAFIIG